MQPRISGWSVKDAWQTVTGEVEAWADASSYTILMRSGIIQLSEISLAYRAKLNARKQHLNRVWACAILDSP
jgi:hypothetical protein